MPSPGLPTHPAPSRAEERSSRTELRLCIDLRDGNIIASVGSIAGAPLPAPQVGTPLSDLWRVGERAAIARRFDDVILLGEDAFGAIALATGEAPTIFVEIEAAFCHLEGRSFELCLRSMAEVGSALPDELAVIEDGPRSWIKNGRPVASVPIIEALRTAGAAALEVDANGLILGATQAARRLIGAAVEGEALTDVFELPDDSAAALEAARERGEAQTVLARCGEDASGLALDWLAGDKPGAGIVVLTASGQESESSERIRFQTQLVSLVAHDVRDSLAAVYCGLRTLAEDLPDESALHAIVADALEESERADRIMKDVLWISRPGDLNRVEIDIDKVVQETIARYRARAKGSSIEVSEDLRSACQILVDLSSFERTIGNLIENALDATPKGGALTIATRREDRSVPGVLISVRDTGIGIKEETRPNVFEPFFTDKNGGTGLGLAIARRVVLDHGGQIHFDSEEGRGTSFHVWLPMTDV